MFLAIIFIITIVIIYKLILNNSNDNVKKKFNEFASEYKKKYRNVEVDKRYNIFKKNLLYINNSQNKPYKLGITKFIDWTDEEYGKLFMKPPTIPNLKEKKKFDYTVAALCYSVNIPSNYINDFNYATDNNPYNCENLNNIIRDQGECSCCWSMACVGLLENAIFKYSIKKNVNIIQLSVQQIIDCVYINLPPDTACEGAPTDVVASLFFKDSVDMCTENKYPYLLENISKYTPTKCPDDCSIRIPPMEVIRYYYFEEKFLQRFVFMNGPVEILFYHANDNDFRLYKGGIYSKPGLVKSVGTHSLILCGWGIEKSTNQQYWICKNSWGTTWGDPTNPGYVWFPRNTGEKYGFENITNIITTINCVRPCIPMNPSAYITAGEPIYNYKKCTLYLYAKAYLPDTSFVVNLRLICNGICQNLKQFVNGNNELLDINNNVISKTQSYFFSDENGTKQTGDKKLDRWFICEITLVSNILIYQTTWDLELEVSQLNHKAFDKITVDWYAKIIIINTFFDNIDLQILVAPLYNVSLFINEREIKIDDILTTAEVYMITQKINKDDVLVFRIDDTDISNIFVVKD